MKLFRVIFLKFLLVFFSVLFGFVSFGQYETIGKIDLIFSVPFSLILAGIGALLSALFICGFKKLDSVPPRVKSQDYIENNEIIIEGKLSKIRHKKILLFLMLIMWLPFGVIIMVFDLPILFVFFYMAFMALCSIIYGCSKCPRCGYYFFYRTISVPHIGDLDTGSEKLNLWCGPGYRNTFSNKCLNCGLSLKKQ